VATKSIKILEFNIGKVTLFGLIENFTLKLQPSVIRHTKMIILHAIKAHIFFALGKKLQRTEPLQEGGQRKLAAFLYGLP
tara:strand:+ start:313 stop:552 length:240 start_codon:yes stop_codon:yes gene_type:complete